MKDFFQKVYMKFLTKYLKWIVIKKFLKKFRPFRLLAYQFRPQYKEYHIFNFLNKKSVFIDMGANIGEISNYVGDRCLSKVFSYEPHPGAYKFLKKRFKNFNNIKVFNCAISNKSSEQYYYFSKSSPNERDLTYSEAGSLESKKSNITIIFIITKKTNEYKRNF